MYVRGRLEVALARFGSIACRICSTKHFASYMWPNSSSLFADVQDTYSICLLSGAEDIPLDLADCCHCVRGFQLPLSISQVVSVRFSHAAPRFPSVEDIFDRGVLEHACQRIASCKAEAFKTSAKSGVYRLGGQSY